MCESAESDTDFELGIREVRKRLERFCVLRVSAPPLTLTSRPQHPARSHSSLFELPPAEPLAILSISFNMEHSTRSQSPPHHVSAAAEPEACAAEVANVISNVEGQAEIKEAAADMPGFALAQKRPTLASLPNELLLLIMEALPPTVAYGVNHQMLAARSLSWTSRILRAFALPQAWPAEVRITTLAQLGKLREMLRASPLTRTHIKSFVFDWHMGRDGCAAIMDFPPETGSLLQLAFRNRRQLWQELALQWNCSVVDNGGSGRRFSHNGRTYGEPGRGGGPGSGPDGKGEDALIKSPQDLNACIIEVIGLLPCLDSFSWKSSVTPMSAETCDALAQHSTLKSLHVTMSSCRNNAHACQYRSLASVGTGH